MSLKSVAQELIVVDPTSLNQDSNFISKPLEAFVEIEPIEVIEPTGEIEITLSDLPGAPEGTVHPEEPIEIEEEVEEKSEDENDLKKSKKQEKWDWESKGPEGFVAWIKERVDGVPTHSGFDSAGLERAISYMEKLDNEISRAMRLDLDGDLDANKIEEVRSKIDDGLNRLQERLMKVKKKVKSKRKKADVESTIIKEGQRIPGIQGIFVTVDVLTSRIARVCINGMVSAGHDIEDIYANQVKKYKLNEREQAQVMQLLEDMGYPLRQDRGFLPEDDMENGIDFATNYKG